MNIQELSVGDWVTYDRDTTPVQIAGLYQRNKQDCVVMSDSYYPEGVVGFVEFVKPIPLTPEILEKNGLELDKKSRWYILKFNDTKINVWIGRTGQGRIEISHPSEFDPEWYFKYADIECLNIAVHQLQHALRLAGVGKEIKL